MEYEYTDALGGKTMDHDTREIMILSHREFIYSDLPQEERIDVGVPADAIERLSQIREFVRAYEPDGMKPSEFIAYGVTQRTLSQFYESGWKLLEAFSL